MSRQSADCAIFLGVCVGLLVLVGLLQPQHKVSFYAKGSPFATLKLYPTWLSIEKSGWQFDQQMPMWHPYKNRDRQYNARYQSERAWLTSLDFDRSRDIQAFKNRFCASTLRPLWPRICEGLDSAYKVGMVCLLVGIFSGILAQGLSAHFLYDYSRRRPSKRTRVAATLVLVVSFLASVLAQAYYLVHVTAPLDKMDSRAPHIVALLGSSKISGASVGFWLLWVAIVVQALQLVVVLLLLKSPYEDASQAMQLRSKSQYGAFDGPPSSAGPWNSQANAGPPRTSVAEALLGLAPTGPPPHWGSDRGTVVAESPETATAADTKAAVPSSATVTTAGAVPVAGVVVGQPMVVAVPAGGMAPSGGLMMGQPPAQQVTLVPAAGMAPTGNLMQGQLPVQEVTVVVGQQAMGQQRTTSYADPTPPQELIGGTSVAEETW